MKHAKTLKWLLIFACLLAAVWAFTLVANAEIVDSGYCGAEDDGSNLTWTLDDAGTLTISGKGKMKDKQDPFMSPMIYWIRLSNGSFTSYPLWPLRAVPKIIHVVVEEGVTSIGGFAFFLCVAIESVSLPDSLTSIGDYAFAGCHNLKEITIPDHVEELGRCSFLDCPNLTSLSLGNGITYLNDDMFLASQNLEKLTIGRAIEKRSLASLQIPYENLTTVAVKEGVTAVANSAFAECENLVDVTLPDSLTSIGSNAFRNCIGIRKLTIPENVESIGSNAFDGCKHLSDLTIGNGVNSIGDSAFDGCWSIETLTIGKCIEKYSLTGIGMPKDLLKTVVISEGVTSVCTGAFSGSSWLADVTIPDGMKALGDRAFAGCVKLSELILPDGLTAIGQNTFADCAGLTSISIPASVKSVGKDAFAGCAGLQAVFIQDLSAWCGISFDGLNANPLSLSHHLILDHEELTGLVIPDDVTAIGNYTFAGCALTDVTIPDGVTSVGGAAFYGCDKLKSLSLGNGIVKIVASAFYGCDGIEELTVGKAIEKRSLYSIFSISAPVETGVLPQSLGDSSLDNPFGSLGGDFSLDSITELFSGLNDPDENSGINIDVNAPKRTDFFPVKKLTVSEGTTEISSGALLGLTSLKTISLPNSLTEIGNSAFSGCAGLESVTIPAGVTKIGSSVFFGCKGLAVLTVAEENTAYTTEDGVLYDKAITELIRYPAAKEGDTFDFPGTVTALAEDAFGDNINLTEITIPNRIRSLGRGCFVRCKNLRRAVCGNGVEKLPELMFMECRSLKEVIAPYGVHRIGKQAFVHCASLSSFTMSADMDMIEANAFFDCKSLDDVYFSGTADEWTAIGVKDGNNALIGARKHFGAEVPGQVAIGDVDGDGKLTAADARLALRASVGLEKDIAKGTAAFEAADADGDGKVSSADARLILRASVGLEDASKFGKKA